MTVNSEILNAMREAFKEAGNQNLFSKKCGIRQDFISKCMNGKVKSICLEKWIKLYPFLKYHLPLDYDSYIKDKKEAHLLAAFRNLSEAHKIIIIATTDMLATEEIKRSCPAKSANI